MENETLIQMMSEETTQLVSETVLQVQVSIASFALLFYASLIHIGDEIQYIWKPKFTLATFLYLLSKYPVFFNLVLIMVGDLVSSLRLCNELGTLINVISILHFIGTQGLISIRTYALCQGYRPTTIALSTMFFVTLAGSIYGATFPSCSPAPSYLSTIDLISNIATILSDILAFLAVIYQVWGLWKEQQSLGIQTTESLVTLLLRQGKLRFCFVLFISITTALIIYISPVIGSYVSILHNVLSALLICEFTLDLRRGNAEKPILNESALELPTLSFRDTPAQSIRSVFGRLHNNIIADIGERNAPAEVDMSDSRGQEECEGEAN